MFNPAFQSKPARVAAAKAAQNTDSAHGSNGTIASPNNAGSGSGPLNGIFDEITSSVSDLLSGEGSIEDGIVVAGAIIQITPQGRATGGLGRFAQTVLRSGLDKHKGGKLTLAGRAFQKHTTRGNAAFGSALNGHKANNAAGAAALKSILRTQSPFVRSNRFGGVDIFDSSHKSLRRGVRTDQSGNFVGFLN